LNLHGFDVQASSNYNTISGNNASSNGAYGFWVEESSNYNTISGNNVSSNTQYGIHLTSSSNNTIYNNYFNNTHNAYDNGNNIWNTTKTEGRNIINGSYLGGNYWSNYAGADTIGSDGLGDNLTPYNSSGYISNGGDYQPLVTIGIADTTAPVITISSPLEGLTYNTSAVALNVSANESITSWQYNAE
jgi:parallel beta-helix repeat protein